MTVYHSSFFFSYFKGKVSGNHKKICQRRRFQFQLQLINPASDVMILADNIIARN